MQRLFAADRTATYSFDCRLWGLLWGLRSGIRVFGLHDRVLGHFDGVVGPFDG